MDEGLFRFLIDCETDRERQRAVTSSCLLVLIGSLAFLLIVAIWGFLLGGENLGWIIGLVLAGAALQMIGALFRGFGDTVSYALVNFISGALTIVLNVVSIAVFRWGVVGMLSATVIAQGGISVVFALARKIWHYIDLSAVDGSYMRRLMRYSIPLIPNKVSWTIMNMSSRLIIMNTLGASPAGLFAIAYRFPNVMDQVYGFFYQSWKESSARALSSKDDEVEFYNDIYRALRRFMMSVVLVMTALMPLVFEILINGSYREGILYVPILLLATYYSNISGFYGGIFTAHKDTEIMGTTTVVSAVLCLVLNLLLIPTMGLYGAAVATLASMICVNEYRRQKVKRYAKLDEDFREIVVTFVAIAVVFACFYLFEYQGCVAAMIVGIVVAFAFFVAINREVLRVGKRMIKERRIGRG